MPGYQKCARVLAYLRKPYDERKDTIRVSEIYRRVQAIREKAGFLRFYACKEDAKGQSHLRCSSIVKQTMQRLHYEEIAWLSNEDRRRFEVVYSNRVSRDVLTSPPPSPPPDFTLDFSDRFSIEAQAGGRIELAELSATNSTYSSLSGEERDAGFVDALVKASFQVDDLAVAAVPVGSRRSDDEFRLRRELMRRIVSEMKNRPVKLRKTAATTNTESGDCRDAGATMGPAKPSRLSTPTSLQLGQVKLKKIGYKSGHRVDNLTIRSSEKRSISPIPRTLASPIRKYTPVPRTQQPTASSHLVRKIENATRNKSSSLKSKKFVSHKSSFNELANKLKTRRQLICPDSDKSIDQLA